MKFLFATVAGLLLTDPASAFVTPKWQTFGNGKPTSSSRSSKLNMAMDAPPPPSNSDVPVIQQNRNGAPTEVRYSEFLKLVNADRLEKVTFSADGSQLLGVDTDGSRIRIEALPNDPDLLTSLTTHKVSIWIFAMVAAHNNLFKANIECSLVL